MPHIYMLLQNKYHVWQNHRSSVHCTMLKFQSTFFTVACWVHWTPYDMDILIALLYWWLLSMKNLCRTGWKMIRIISSRLRHKTLMSFWGKVWKGTLTLSRVFEENGFWWKNSKTLKRRTNLFWKGNVSFTLENRFHY